MAKKLPKNCRSCKFCKSKDTRYPYCDLTNDGSSAAIVLIKLKERVMHFCPLHNKGKGITAHAYAKHFEKIEEYLED